MATYTPRPGSKIEKILAYMNANFDKDMDTVCTGMLEFVQTNMADCRSYYRWAVKEGIAPGVVVTSKVKVPFVKVVKEVKAKELVEKSVDEVARIKEANLARMKEVSAKLKTKKVRDYGTRVAREEAPGVDDFNPTLAREEVDAILRDERLLDVCPKFVREDI